MRYLVLTPYLGIWYPKGAHFELIDYFDADYLGCKVDRKSTFETCQFFRSLVCWSSEKQNSIVLFTSEAEYVAAKSCCAQLLWMRQTLRDYSYTLNHVPLLCDNESVTKIAYNCCEHCRTKHIDIRHQFFKDHAIKRDIVISHVRTNKYSSISLPNPLMREDSKS
jgi:hypothetical protein